MPKYRVPVYVQYDDYVEVEAEDRREAIDLAEREALRNMGVFASADIRVYEDNIEELNSD